MREAEGLAHVPFPLETGEVRLRRGIARAHEQISFQSDARRPRCAGSDLLSLIVPARPQAGARKRNGYENRRPEPFFVFESEQVFAKHVAKEIECRRIPVIFRFMHQSPHASVAEWQKRRDGALGPGCETRFDERRERLACGIAYGQLICPRREDEVDTGR
jgi:hypothetical protein